MNHNEINECAQLALSKTPFSKAQIRNGGSLLGGLIGDTEGMEGFAKEKVDKLCEGLSKLLSIGQDHPQELNSAYSSSFQHKWTFLQRTHEMKESMFEPLENMIKSQVIPTIFRWLPTNGEREITALPVRKGGLGIINPVEKAAPNYQVAKKATATLVESLKGNAPWDPTSHNRCFTSAAASYKADLDKQYDAKMKEINDNPRIDPAVKRAFKRASSFPTGHFLLAKPVKRNGATLSAAEFRDGVDLRYGRKPPDLPPECYACADSIPLTLQHALTCKKGGGIVGRHDIVLSYELSNNCGIGSV